jgi:hypothetical protein
MSQEEACLIALYFVNALFSAVFFTRIRFRLPMDWLLLAIDAGMIALIAARASSENPVAARELRRLKRSMETESPALRVARRRLSMRDTLRQQ